MNDNRVIDYLGHMLEAARLAYSYVEGLDKDDFLATPYSLLFRIP